MSTKMACLIALGIAQTAVAAHVGFHALDVMMPSHRNASQGTVWHVGLHSKQTRNRVASMSVRENSTQKIAVVSHGVAHGPAQQANVSMIATASMVEVTGRQTSAAMFSLRIVGYALLLFLVFLRFAPAPHGIGASYHAVVASARFKEFGGLACFEKAAIVVLMAYFTWIFYPVRTINFWARHRRFGAGYFWALIIYVINLTLLLPLLMLLGLVHVCKPFPMIGKSAEGPLARYFHFIFAIFSYLLVHQWSGSNSPSQTSILSKDHWRQILTSAGAFVPDEIARWDPKNGMKWTGPFSSTNDIVVKPELGCVGESSTCFKHGEDFKTKEDVERKMAEFYANETQEKLFKVDADANEYLLLDRVHPDSRGVHDFGIVTAVDSTGEVCVIYISHTVDCPTYATNIGEPNCYSVNASTEEIEGRTHWWMMTFGFEIKDMPDRTGQKVPDIKAACEYALEAHKISLQHNPQRLMLGFDCMVVKDGRICFFEGNSPCARLGRIMFNNWTSVYLLLRGYTPSNV